MKVLIVEDEIIAASYLKEMVLEVDCEVVGTVGTGRGAIELASLKKPDLILMDIMLKDNISGVDAAMEIQYKHKEITIIFLTAYSDTEMIETAIQSNTYGYFLKPYNKDEILANLKILKGKKHKREKQTFSAQNEENIMLAEGYNYSLKYKQLYLHQKEVYLSKRECQILDYFCRNRHMVSDFQTIIHHIWGAPKPLQTLRSLICRIREKTSQSLIVSVNKMGYRLGLKE